MGSRRRSAALAATAFLLGHVPAFAQARALGTLRTATHASTIGAAFVNGTGFPIWTLVIGHTGEHWRLGTQSPPEPDRLRFQYSLDARASTRARGWTSRTSTS